jgi:hypothetical protein
MRARNRFRLPASKVLNEGLNVGKAVQDGLMADITVPICEGSDVFHSSLHKHFAAIELVIHSQKCVSKALVVAVDERPKWRVDPSIFGRYAFVPQEGTVPGRIYQFIGKPDVDTH